MKKLMLVNTVSGEILSEGDEIAYVKFKKTINSTKNVYRVQTRTLKPFIRTSKSKEASSYIGSLTIRSQARLFAIVRRLGVKNRILKEKGYCRNWEDLLKIEELQLTKRSLTDFRLELIKNDIVREHDNYLVLNPIIAVDGHYFDRSLLYAFEDVITKNSLLTPREIEFVKGVM